MYQVTFSDQSIKELNKLDKLAQIELIGPLGSLTAAELANPREPLGKFSRADGTYYRLRSGDYRIYFTVKGEELHTRCILHKNSLTDFVFRTKLPVTEEQLVEQHTSFWKYLETLGK
jgi:mRNA interferase RelE/StbE